MAIPDVEYIVPSLGFDDDLAASPESHRSQRKFKQHRVLPHPRNGSGSLSGTTDLRRTGSGGQRYCEDSHPESSKNKSSSHVASHHTLRHQRRNLSGGDLPPTPPAHSRTSSGSHSVNLSIPSPLQTPAQSSEGVPSKANPSTPPNQRSPPTPDVTPPQTHITSRSRPPTVRPALYNRNPSKSTTDSRVESFRTARESPVPSDGEDEGSTSRPALISANTSQVTVRQTIGRSSEHRQSQSCLGLGLGLESDVEEDPAALTPKPRGKFNSFDGEWSSGSDVEPERDGNLSRNVTVRQGRPSKQADGQEYEVVDDFTVSPTNATKALRSMPLHGRILTYGHPETPRSFAIPEPAATEAVIDTNSRRFSAMSTRSTASTVVEAILVETPPRHQRRTLRHVKRVDALRDSIWNSPPLTPAPALSGANPRRQSGDHARDALRESYASNTTVNSSASRKARREVSKKGGIPVAVIPDRLSSNKPSSREQSLRSISSRRSKRSQSLSSVPLEHLPNVDDLTLYSDRPPGSGRLMSESDGSTPGDQRTMDFPPDVPGRTSSLSASGSRSGSRAPSGDVSRNESRTGSLTAESLRAHNAMQAKLAKGISPVPSVGGTKYIAGKAASSLSGEQADLPVVTVRAVPALEQSRSSGDQEGSEGQKRLRDSGSSSGGPPLSTKATPFSQVSVETSGTSAADIGEARAIRMVPHQISTVVMVGPRPSDSLDGDQRTPVTARPDQPTITTTEVNGATIDDVGSPPRDSLVTPEPPDIHFIPATPSGLTPAEEKNKMLGNFYEELEEEPVRTPSIFRRALGRRRHSYNSPSPRPSFLSRTFSLSRSIRGDASDDSDLEDAMSDSQPGDVDETRLHPDWRPSYQHDYYDNDYGVYDDEDEEGRRYSAGIHPDSPRRSLSERVKRTFAIMPLQQEIYDHEGGPVRRTLKRTSSGNLRLVRKRSSAGSLREKKERRRSPSPIGRRLPFFGRSSSMRSQRRQGGVAEKEKEKEKPDRANPPRTSLTRRWSMSQNIGSLTRRLSEKRREKRSNELRQKISGPREFRDGLGEGFRDAFTRPRKMLYGVIPGVGEALTCD